VQILREHFQLKGYRVHSGLQFGCELVLYADEPGKVHSDFCVHLVGSGTELNLDVGLQQFLLFSTLAMLM